MIGHVKQDCQQTHLGYGIISLLYMPGYSIHSSAIRIRMPNNWLFELVFDLIIFFQINISRFHNGLSGKCTKLDNI